MPVADREHAVVAGRAHERAAVGPHAAQPHRRARLLQRRRAHAALVEREGGPSRVTASPRHSSTTSSSASSSSAARARGSRSSPKALSSRRLSPPRPAPKTMRPPESRSSTATWRATSHGRRRASGVTMAPRRRRSVASATAVSAIHGSAIVEPVEGHDVVPHEEAVPAARLGLRGDRGQRADVGQLAEGRDVEAVSHVQAAAAATGQDRRTS